jgi:cytochrome c oxidase cbb3-type subunit III
MRGKRVFAHRTSLLAAVIAAAAAGECGWAQEHAGQYAEADIEYGARLYSGHCVTCHGERGDSMPGVNLRSGNFRRAPSDRDVTNLISNGIPDTAMIPTAYTPSELAALVAYLRNMGTIDLAGMPSGDERRGRELFVGKGECDSCHRVDGIGPRFAPDLSNIGAVRTAATLERSLLDPNEALLPVNRPVRAVLRDGTAIEGRRLNEDTFTVQIIDREERLWSLDKSTLRDYRVEEEARMPSYEDVFDEQERADLVTYMLTLKGQNR